MQQVAPYQRKQNDNPKLPCRNRHRRAATKSSQNISDLFADNVEAELNQAGLSFDKIEWFAAPRRLAVKVLNLATQQPSKEIENEGLQYQPPLMRKVNQLKRQKAGRVVVALLLSKQNALQLIKANGSFTVQKLKVSRPKLT